MSTDIATQAQLLDAVMVRYTGRLRHAIVHSGGCDPLTVQQFQCLQLLAVTGSALTTQLARQMNVAIPTVTGRIDGLVARGFVERQQNLGDRGLGDRRRIQLVLTAAGRAQLDRRQQALTGELQGLLMHLDSSRQGRLAAALHDLRQVLAPESDPAPTPAERYQELE